jgi:formylglycine-generating enzyme required for sulfatase activity/RNA polymerase subunit RPABC4/transcription elongation factor Spt4
LHTFTCPHCNQPHPADARFCPVTGDTIPQLVYTCVQCGKEVKKEVNFCPYCGGKEFEAAALRLVPDKKKGTGLPINILTAILGVLLVAAAVYVLRPYLFPGPPTQTSGPVVIPQGRDTPVDPTLTSTSTASATPTSEPSATATFTLTPTASATIPPTLTPTPSVTNTPIGYSRNRKDNAEIIFIPPGEFLMGSDKKDDPYFWGAEAPSHRVTLDGYWMYRLEVTNSMYQVCVADKACPKPGNMRFKTMPDYYGNPTYDDYPMVNVTYRSAAAYCVWSGGRLPTEAQWEKAARGTDGRLFAWGNALPGSDLVNLCDQNCFEYYADSSLNDGYPETAPVGSYPKGASPYGLLDMSGNVWEWVSDWFNEAYYKVSPDKNPRGPATGTLRVIRGGSYYNGTEGVRVVARAFRSPDNYALTIGFRCVVDEP